MPEWRGYFAEFAPQVPDVDVNEVLVTDPGSVAHDFK